MTHRTHRLRNVILAAFAALVFGAAIGLSLGAIPAECATCGSQACAFSSECPIGCTCAKGDADVWGRCAS